MNLFAAHLAQTAERNELAFRVKSGLLFKLPERRFLRIFVVVNFTLWHHPGAIILVPPVWAARMCEKHL